MGSDVRFEGNMMGKSEEAEDPDATECSSSFEESGLSDLDSEVESDLNSGRMFHSRETSAHWRSFSRPIRWRCVLSQLKIEILKSQYKKCERKIEELSKMSSSMCDETESFVLPLVQRKKRRRVEATNDVETYMSNHNIFSYYEQKKKNNCDEARPVSKIPGEKRTQLSFCMALHYAQGELLDQCILLWVYAVKIDYEKLDEVKQVNSFEMVEKTLGMIMNLQSKLADMKARMGRITSEHCREFFNASGRPTRKRMYGMSMGSHFTSSVLSRYNMGAMLLPVEGGVANGSNDQSCSTAEDDDDDVLMDNHWVRAELDYLELEKQVKIRVQNRTPLVRNENKKHEDCGAIRTDPVVVVEPSKNEASMSMVVIKCPKNEAPTSNERPKRKHRSCVTFID